MIKKISAVIIVLALALSACTINGYPISLNSENITGSGTLVTENRTVSGFDKVDLKGLGNLTIEVGDKESLTVTADDNLIDYITTEVFNDTLDIGIKPNLSLTPSRSIEYKLTVKDLSSITLSGFGNINVGDLTSEDLEVKLSGSGDLNFSTLHAENALIRVSGFGNIDADLMVIDQPNLEITGSGDIKVEDLQAITLEVKISGFGNADLEGATTDLNIELLGSGNYRGGDMQSEDARVKITGFGDATVWATDNLDVTITGSGNVDYYGNPSLSQTLTGFGKINSRGEH